jgi:hypothetical protein
MLGRENRYGAARLGTLVMGAKATFRKGTSWLGWFRCLRGWYDSRVLDGGAFAMISERLEGEGGRREAGGGRRTNWEKV